MSEATTGLTAIMGAIEAAAGRHKLDPAQLAVSCSNLCKCGCRRRQIAIAYRPTGGSAHAWVDCGTRDDLRLACFQLVELLAHGEISPQAGVEARLQ